MKLFETPEAPPAAPPPPENASGAALEALRALIPSLNHSDTVAAASALMDALPETKFEGIDVGRELLLQYQVVKQLQTSLLDDNSVPANQRAQVANAVAGTLQAITVAQSKFYTSERFKRIEGNLVKLLNSMAFPEDLKLWFFEQYEKLNASV